MFATDRDLLVFEPRLLSEVAWMGQRVYSSASVSIGSGGASVTDGSGPFGSFGIGVGSVLLLAELAVEVVEIVSATEVGVSLIRADSEGTAIAASSLGSTVGMDVYTFAPQIELVHRQVLRGLGLAQGMTEPGGDPSEDRVVNVGAVAAIESLGALHLIYSAAVPLASESSVIERKAAQYLDRFREARLGTGVEIDLDGNGDADATRRIGAFLLVRR